jgi:alginate O-acetyltransferase complex protein AlgJ
MAIETTHTLSPGSARLARRIRIFGFCVALLVPGLLGLFGIRGIEGFVENRSLAEPPWAAPRGFDLLAAMRGFDAWISDNFGLRPLLIYNVARFKLALGDTNGSQVLLGRHGWMFLPALSPLFGEILGIPPVDATTVAKWKTVFEQRQRWVQRQGARFIFAIPPGKALVYPEFLPDWLRQRLVHTRAPWFVDELDGTGIDVLYLKGALLSAKHFGRLYYKFDMHWNFLGSFIGAAAIIDHIHALDRRVRPLSVERYDRQLLWVDTLHGGLGPLDLGVLVGDPFLRETDERIIRASGWTTTEETVVHGRDTEFIYTRNAPHLPTLVFIHDSFGYPMRRFIAEHFRRAVFVNPWLAAKSLADQFPADIIREERPDFVIYMRCEDWLLTPTANPPEVADSPASPARGN